MANTIIGNGDVTAVGVVRGAKVRVPSLADFELGTTLKTGDLAATLAGKAASTHTHAAGDITSGLAAVATSGSYNDLSDKPTIPDVSVKRDKTDLSVYVLSWDFSEFKAIQPTYIYSIKNEEGVGDYVEASGSLGTGPKNVASLMVEQPTAGAWYYHIETITEDGQALNFGPLAGHDIKKTAYEPGTDTLAKVSQIPSVPVSSVNSKTGAVVLTGDDLKFSNEIQSSTVAEAITGLAQEIASSVVTSWQTTPDDTHFPSEKLTKDSLDAKITNPSGGDVGSVLKKTASGVEWGTDVSGVAWGSITGTLSNQTDLGTALSAKIDLPSGGSIGNVLKKTASGVAWGTDSSEPAAYLKSASVSSDVLTLTKKDDTTVQFDMSGKMSAPTGGSAGDVLKKTANGTEWGSPSVAWGSVSGTLSNQTDLSSALSGKQDASDLVTSFSSTPLDSKYPSEKLVKRSLDEKEEIVTVGNGLAKTPNILSYKWEVLADGGGVATTFLYTATNPTSGVSVRCYRDPELTVGSSANYIRRDGFSVWYASASDSGYPSVHSWGYETPVIARYLGHTLKLNVSASGVLKSDGSGGITSAVPGTDYPTVASVSEKRHNLDRKIYNFTLWSFVTSAPSGYTLDPQPVYDPEYGWEWYAVKDGETESFPYFWESGDSTEFFSGTLSFMGGDEESTEVVEMFKASRSVDTENPETLAVVSQVSSKANASYTERIDYGTSVDTSYHGSWTLSVVFPPSGDRVVKLYMGTSEYECSSYVSEGVLLVSFSYGGDSHNVQVYLVGLNPFATEDSADWIFNGSNAETFSGRSVSKSVTRTYDETKAYNSDKLDGKTHDELLSLLNNRFNSDNIRYTSGDGTSLRAKLDAKITNPSGGSAGNVLKKTASGVEWGSGGGGEPDAYIKSASVSSDVLTLTNKDDSTVTLDVSGKVSSFSAVGGVTPTVDSGTADLSALFTSANTSLTGLLPYPTNTAGTILDRNINVVSAASVTVPDNFTDLLIRATVASGGSLAVTMPSAITTVYGDAFPAEGGEWIVTITKTGAAEAYVRSLKMEVANA